MFNDHRHVITLCGTLTTSNFTKGAYLARRALREYDKIIGQLHEAEADGLAGMIGICITRRMHHRRDISGALTRPPFVYEEVDVDTVLETHAGNDSTRHLWYVDSQGLYHLHANRRLRVLEYGFNRLEQAA